MLQNYPAILLTILERGVVNKQGRVFIIARLKIFPSYHQELKSHQIPEHIEALYYFCQQKNSSNLSQTAINHIGRVSVQCHSFVLRICCRFHHIDRAISLASFPRRPFPFISRVRTSVVTQDYDVAWAAIEFSWSTTSGTHYAHQQMMTF